MWTNVTSPLFSNWMRYSTRDPLKLWGRVDEVIPMGSYALKLNNLYDVTLFQGEKWVIVSEN